MKTVYLPTLPITGGGGASRTSAEAMAEEEERGKLSEERLVVLGFQGER